METETGRPSGLYHPVPADPVKPQTSEQPLVAAEQGVKEKYDRYVRNYNIAKDDVKPLVFETYGGYAKCTFDFLKSMVQTIAKGEAKLIAKLMRALRERIAIALMTHHAYVIMWMNQREQTTVVETVEALGG